MQHGRVLLVGDRPQDFLLARGGVGQESQALVAVAGQDHVVEGLGPCRIGLDDHRVRVAPYGADRRGQAHPVTEATDQRAHVLLRSPLHRLPLGTLTPTQHAVVAEELHDEAYGDVSGLPAADRPERRTHGDQVVVDEFPGVALQLHELAEGNVAVGLELVGGLAVEAQDSSQHPVEARAQQIASLGEERVERLARVLQSAALIAYAEAHGARL